MSRKNIYKGAVDGGFYVLLFCLVAISPLLVYWLLDAIFHFN